MASRALGIPISKINHAETSTDKVPNATTSAASMTADLNGPAIMVSNGYYGSFVWVLRRIQRSYHT